MKTAVHLFLKNISLLVIISMVSALVLLPLASNTSIPFIIDYLNHLSAIMQAKLALTQGQLPLRIAPTDHAGWPYPLFQFYSPTSYMISGFIYQWITPSNPYIAFKLTLWGALIIGGIYMYRLCYWFIASRSAAILGCVAYLSTPYFVIMINHLGAYNETIAVAILPAVLYYTLQYYYHPTTLRKFLLCGIAWYLLATIHLLTFLSTSVIIATFLMLLTLQDTKRWHNLILTGVVYIFGCLLAMWFLGPIGILSKYLMINYTFSDPAFFYAHTPSLANLLAPATSITTITAHTDKILDANILIHPNVGLSLLLAIGVSCYIFF